MRRIFQGARPFPIAGVLLLAAGIELAAAQSHFELRPPQPATDPDRIVVTEFFSYQCPHCYAFHPALRHWASQLPADVVLERVPVSIGHEPWVPIAQAFHALRAMDELDALDAAIFRAIHVERVRLYDKESIVAWVRGMGVDEDEFSRVYDSFGVHASLERGERRSQACRIPSTPTLVVDGRYVMPISNDGTFEQQLAAVGRLIDEARTLRDQSRAAQTR